MLLQALTTSAFRAIRANKSRSFLTMLGIIIGISSVIIVLSVGASAQSLILSQIQRIGSNLIVIFPGEADKSGPPASVLGIVVTTLTDEDIAQIRDPRRVPGVVAATGYVRGVDTIVAGNRTSDSTFMGVDADYIKVESAEIDSGRFFDQEEVRAVSKVAILGSALAEDLFLGLDPLNQRVKIKNEFFTVIGVFKERGPVAFQNPDNYIYVPLKTAQKLLLGIDHISFARVKVNAAENVGYAVEQVRQTLREEHDLTVGEPDDFDIRASVEALGILTSVTDGVKYFLSSVAAISLLVGGIGIMNIMFVAITERTREIGLRKALGAKKRTIIWQFVLEAVVISGVGGVLGILIGAGLTGIIGAIIQKLGNDWPIIVTTQSIILGAVFSLVIGYVFGIYPAVQASKLNPIEALRYE